MKMNIVLNLLFIVLFAIIVLAILKQKRVTAWILIVSGMIGITGMYFFHTSFRDNLNMQFNPTEGHRYTVNNMTSYLPLPPKTALKYRTSDESAVYITKSDFNEIITLYKNISDKYTFTEKKDNNKDVLLFEYNNHSFCIFVEMYEKSRKVWVQGDV